MVEPPSSAGAVHSSFTAWWPSVAVKPVGAPGGRGVLPLIAMRIDFSEVVVVHSLLPS